MKVKSIPLKNFIKLGDIRAISGAGNPLHNNNHAYYLVNVGSDRGECSIVKVNIEDVLIYEKPSDRFFSVNFRNETVLDITNVVCNVEILDVVKGTLSKEGYIYLLARSGSLVQTYNINDIIITAYFSGTSSTHSIHLSRLITHAVLEYDFHKMDKAGKLLDMISVDEDGTSRTLGIIETSNHAIYTKVLGYIHAHNTPLIETMHLLFDISGKDEQDES